MQLSLRDNTLQAIPAVSADEEEQAGDRHSRPLGIRSFRSSVAVRVDRDAVFL